MSTLRRLRHWWVGPVSSPWDALLLTLLGLAILWPAFGVSLLGDDWIYWGAAQGAGGLLDVGGGGTRPVGSAALVFLLGSLDGAPVVLGGLRIAHHVLNGFLVLLVAARVFRLPGAMARIAAVAFLVWSAHAEIFWHSSAHDVLAATFVLIALRLSATAPKVWTVAALAVCALLGYLSKESSWILPLLLLGVWALRGGPRRLWPVIVAAAMLAVAIALRIALAGGVWVDMGAPVLAGLGAGQVAASVIKLVFRSVVPGWISGQELVPLLKPVAAALAAALVGLGLVTVLWGRTRRWWATHLREPVVLVPLLYLVTLAPVATLSVSAADTQNVRYLTVPAIFIALGAALFVSPGGYRRTRGILLGAFLVLQAGSLTYLGKNWTKASVLQERYRGGLVALARAHPSARSFYLLCAPDTYRGAYIARNASGPLLRAQAGHGSATAVDLVAVSLSAATSGASCRIARLGGALVLTATTPGVRLTHPEFHRGHNPARSGPWRISAAALRHSHAPAVRLELRAPLPPGSVIAMYEDSRFREVPAPR